MTTVGLTGGIGSGKSTVAKVFAILGIPVFNSDLAAKSCYEDENVKFTLASKFGVGIFENRVINFKKLSDLVFKDSKELAWLNQQIHPMVKFKFEQWLEQQSAPYVIKEAAILFESGANHSCDKVITVVANQDLRIKRVSKRDHLSSDKILERIHQQWADEQKINLSDFVIYNNTELIVPQILVIHQQLISTNFFH